MPDRVEPITKSESQKNLEPKSLLTSDELLEIERGLYYLGKALYLYTQQIEQDGNVS